MNGVSSLNESTVEDAALAYLERLGWGVAHGPDIAPDTPGAERRDYGDVVLAGRLQDALVRLNSDLPAGALDDAFRKLTRLEGTSLAFRNRVFHRLVVDGVTVEYRDVGGGVRGAQVKVIDFDDPSNNDWLAVNQFTVTENKNTRRPDVVLFVNGLPLGIIELKNPVDEDATIWTAWQQLQTYKAELQSLFAMNAALMVSDGMEARVGTLTAGREWFKPWRTISGKDVADSNMPELQVMLEGVCDFGRFLFLVRDFVVFEDDGSGVLMKKMAGYHQFHAVRVAVGETRQLLKGEISSRLRKNVVQARSFADMLEQTILRYQNRTIEAAYIIEELIALGKEMREAQARGKDLGMTEEELAFYDALETNDSAVQILGDETLRTIARELVRTVRENVTIDWTLRENVRANLRRLVKRILRKHGYPPDKADGATLTVLKQAEMLSEGWAVG